MLRVLENSKVSSLREYKHEKRENVSFESRINLRIIRSSWNKPKLGKPCPAKERCDI